MSTTALEKDQVFIRCPKRGLNRAAGTRDRSNPKAKIVNHPSRRPRNWRLWKTLTVLADELRISQSFSDYAAHDFNKPASVIVFALVESERLLIQIPEQMKRLDVHIRSVDAALEQRPKVFQSVGVDAPFHVALGMIDELVGVF